MCQATTSSDSFVSEDDFEQFKRAINEGDFQRLVLDLMELEPDIAIAVADRNRRLDRLLERLGIPLDQIASVNRQFALSVWIPLLALSRAHRREWDAFLPSTRNVNDTPDTKEGGQ